MADRALIIRYGEYLAAQGVRHFAPLSDPVLSTVPPESLWLAAARTLLVLDWLREEVGGAIGLTSGYRSPEHNADVGGAQASRHMTGDGYDLHAYGRLSPAQLAALMATHPQADTLGIGAYQHDGHIHVDTRGHRARWSVPGGYWP